MAKAPKTVSRKTMTLTDDKGKVLRAPKDDAEAGMNIKFAWWKSENDEELAKNIAGTILFLQDKQGDRQDRLIEGSRLYGAASATNVIGAAVNRTTNSTPMTGRVCFNLCQSVGDTLVSKIAKNKVTPTFVTSGGVWKMQRKAEKLSKFTDGTFYENKAHKLQVMQFLDSFIWGDGFIHVYPDYEAGKARAERALPHEFVLDMVESTVAKPMQLHRLKMLDRDVCKEIFCPEDTKEDKELAAKIDMIMPPNYTETGGLATAADLINVTESWHLRSGPNATDGLHVIAAGDVILYKEVWEKDYFPFVRFTYSRRPIGYYGQGGCERLSPLQLAVNREMILQDRSSWMMGSFKILLENGSKVVSQHLNNDVGTIIHYTGTPPQYVTPPSVDANKQALIDSYIAKGYQQEGVSQLSAASLKPMGVNSGKGLRTMTNIEDDRFLWTQQDLEENGLELARQLIEAAKDIYKRKKTYKSTFVGTRFIETIDWKDIQLEADEYVMKAFPVNSLSDDPSERFDQIQEYMQAGMLSPRAGRKLMSMPDVEMSDALANATEDLLCKVLEEMLDSEGTDDDYTPPEPYWDLQLAQQMTLEYLNYAELHNAPEANIQLLRDFLQQVQELIPPPPAPMPTPGATPPANPTATPTSPLLQNTNQQGAA